MDSNMLFFQGYSPIPKKTSLAQCQIECYNFGECQFWTYEIPTRQCYLKTKKRNNEKSMQLHPKDSSLRVLFSPLFAVRKGGEDGRGSGRLRLSNSI